MRSEDQVKRKRNELLRQLKDLQEAMREDAGLSADSKAARQARIDQLSDSIALLEWVLNEPSGSYH